MTTRTTPKSPLVIARAAGFLCLLTILMGIFAQMFISARLVVEGDAAATATNILAHTDLFQLGLAAYLIEMACSIAMTGLFYSLFKPVSRNISLLAAFFSLIGIAIKTISRLFYIAPLLVLGGAHYLTVFNAEQLQALALLFLKVNDRGAGISLIFLGFHALLIGCLVIRSTFLPRILGVLGVFGGLGWLVFLYPPFADRLFSYILALLDSAAEILWLLIVGVNVPKWEELAAEAA